MFTSITIPKQFTHGDELILVRRKDYEELQKYVKETKRILKIVKAGERELKSGKIKPIHSIAELMK